MNEPHTKTKNKTTSEERREKRDEREMFKRKWYATLRTRTYRVACPWFTYLYAPQTKQQVHHMTFVKEFRGVFLYLFVNVCIAMHMHVQQHKTIEREGV